MLEIERDRVKHVIPLNDIEDIIKKNGTNMRKLFMIMTLKNSNLIWDM